VVDLFGVFVSRSDFPQLASQGSWRSKNVPLKGNSSGLLARQKSASGKPTERPLSSSPASSQSALKLKNDAMTKHSGKKRYIAPTFVVPSVCLIHLTGSIDDSLKY
jgi:hypothetical protein